MIRGATLLVALALAGELVVTLTHLPVPGPVVGMLLCFVLLAVTRAIIG